MSSKKSVKLPKSLIQHGREYRFMSACGSDHYLAYRADHDFSRGPAPLVVVHKDHAVETGLMTSSSSPDEGKTDHSHE